jgi:Protein of unknown function (DUF1587)/Planctomycete cytochrome C
MRCLRAALLSTAALASALGSQQPAATRPSIDNAGVRGFVSRYCTDCHNSTDKTAGLDLDSLSNQPIDVHPQAWESVIRKMSARQMPPGKASRPDEHTYELIVASLENALDASAATHPNPGRTYTFRRMNRTEYQNAIRDLLSLEIDGATLLPKDESSRSFDNLVQGDLSPTLLERYVSAAQRIAGLAIGGSGRSANSQTFRIPPDQTQEEQVEGLVPGTRGGTMILSAFPQDGDYDIQLWLTRDRNEQIEGLSEPHDLEVLLDRQRVANFLVTPSAHRKDRQELDDQFKARIPIKAGPHQLDVTFVKHPSSLLETKRQPYQAHFNPPGSRRQFIR